MRRRIYVWEVPVRLTHWVNVASIIILSFTGYYIGNPFILVSLREPYGAFFMGLIRYIHFITAFVFVASLLLRTYWAFTGNEFAGWRALFPFLTKEGRKAMGEAITYYLFIRRHPPEVTGHNALAGMTYMFIVCFYAIITFTGFALYGQIHPVGIFRPMTEWVFAILSIQQVRMIHHMIMYLLIAFALHHIYSAWLVDMEEGNGLMSSIFSGFKFIHHNAPEDWMETGAKRRRTVTAKRKEQLGTLGDKGRVR